MSAGQFIWSFVLPYLGGTVAVLIPYLVVSEYILRRQMKRPCHDADEQDAFTKWRHVMIWRAGERKAIKRRANRRDRRQSREAIRRDLHDDGLPMIKLKFYSPNGELVAEKIAYALPVSIMTTTNAPSVWAELSEVSDDG